MDAPKLEFPCDYPIKVMIRVGPGVRPEVDAVLARHAGPLGQDRVSERPSREGHFAGITYLISARDEAHIAALFADLKSVPGVLMVI
jgi:putative lipoic acid-binding regulatory protein